MKNYKLFFLCLLIAFLDVAILPFGCRPKEKEKIMFVFEIYESENVFVNTSNFLNTDLRVGDTITVEQFEELYNIFINDLSFYYWNPNDQNSYDVEIKSFATKSVHLAGEIHSFDEITLPYTIDEDDFSIYYCGIRNVLVFKIVLYADYNLIPKE